MGGDPSCGPLPCVVGPPCFYVTVPELLCYPGAHSNDRQTQQIRANLSSYEIIEFQHHALID